MLAPKWFPFHVDKISYWSRTVMIPLTVLTALKPRACNPRGVDIRELFVTPPEEVKNYIVNPTGSWLGRVMLELDRIGRVLEPFIPRFLERKGIEKAMALVEERLNGEDGHGGIFPAMANTVMAFDTLGYPRDRPDFVTARKAIDKLLVLNDDWGYCQPCLSPVWDTGLAAHAVMEADLAGDHPVVEAACEWLVGRQIRDVKGDWKANRGHLRPGGWAFQYWNDHYPDVDDSAVVVMALHRAGKERFRETIERGAEWIIGMQSRSGGWGAFDADNEFHFLQNIPFADHGALLDPPTADVSARCLSMLAQLGYDRSHPAVARVLAFLKREQEDNGSWFGRWGNNYVYGTWSVLSALHALGEDVQAPYIRKAAEWLKSCQRPDGGWGEDCATYWQYRRDEVKTSTPSQTAWALLGLMAASEVESDSVRRGVRVPPRGTSRGGVVEGRVFQRRGLPAHLLPALPRLQQVFPAVGAGAVPHPSVGRRQDVTSWGVIEPPRRHHRARHRSRLPQRFPGRRASLRALRRRRCGACPRGGGVVDLGRLRRVAQLRHGGGPGWGTGCRHRGDCRFRGRSRRPALRHPGGVAGRVARRRGRGGSGDHCSAGWK